MEEFPGRTWFLLSESTAKLCLTKKSRKIFVKNKLKDCKVAVDF